MVSLDKIRRLYCPQSGKLKIVFGFTTINIDYDKTTVEDKKRGKAIH